MIAAKDNLTLTWFDVLHQENLLWGTLYYHENNDTYTPTGMVKMIMEYQVDVTTAIYCGLREHRSLGCSIAIEYDGFAGLLLKPKPLPNYLGIILPFDIYTWVAILGTVLVTTLILGVCLKYILKSQEVDWTLHFLDALHPMCGRNMLLPGLQAAHLGRE